MESLELGLPPDHRRDVPTSRVSGHGEEPRGRDRLCLTLQLDWFDCLRFHSVEDETQGLAANQDLAWLGRLLQPGRDVDGVAGREPLLRARDDLAGVHADPRLDAELGQRVSHLDGGADGAQSVVLVHVGNTEDGHHRVADELLHVPAVGLHDRLHPLEVASKQRAHRLGISRLSERCRAGHVAEEDGDGLALLSRRSACELGTAIRTEREVSLHRSPAVRASTHEARLDRLRAAHNRAVAACYRFPRSACSRSIDSKRALKLPSPKVVAPWRSITSKKTVGRSCAVFVKICSR
jgi:hypothetical protein